MGIGINVFICLLASEILTLQHYILHMDQNVKQTTVNQMYAALREIDSYKYGLVSKEVLLLQSSMLVFIKEGINPRDEIFTKIDNDKSYLLNMIWSQVKMYWDGSVENIPSLRSIYNKIVYLSPTSNECAMVLDAILDKSRTEYEDPNPTKGLAELAATLLDYHKGEVVYNPNAGVGSFAHFIDFGNDYFGWASASIQWYVGIAMMLLADKMPSANYLCAEHSSRDIFGYDRYINIFNSREVKYEDVFSGLTSNGKAILIMPTGMLLRPRSQFNQMIIENNVLDKVILLPSSMIKETGVSYAVFVCENNRPQDKHITILDCRGEEYYSVERGSRKNNLHVSKVLSDLENESIGNKIEVSQQQIAEARYVIDPSLYSQPHVEIPEGYEVSPLKDLTVGYDFRMNQIESTTDKVVIRASDLEFNTTDFIVGYEQILANDDRKPTGGVLLEKSCVIVAAKNRSISAAYYEFKEGDKIYADARLWLFEVDETRIDPRYLVSKLRSYEVSTLRSVIPYSYILTLPITYPSLVDQRRIIEDTIKASKQSKIRELGLTEEIQRLKNEYKTLIRTKKHNLGTVRGNISATVRQLQKQVEQSSQTGEIDIKALLGRVNRLVGYWKDLDGRLDRIADENKFKEVHEFGFDQFFRKLESNIHSSNYTLSYNLDKATFDNIEAIFAIHVNPDDFRQVVENIISNAEKHGFRDPNREDYYLNINVYCDESVDGENRVCFVFENNGYPAPEMTNAQFGMSGWHADVKGSKGEGLGGAYINEMTRHFGGGYEAPHSVKDEIGEYSRTRVMIYFPAIIKFDETTFMKEYAFDTIYNAIYDYLKYEDYDISTGFDITFEEELEVYIIQLQDYGYDLNDDDTLYIDQNGRPYHSNPPEDIHWINDVTCLDDNANRVVNTDYLKQVVNKLLSRYRERLYIRTN